jgi:hypothetical protein
MLFSKEKSVWRLSSVYGFQDMSGVRTAFKSLHIEKLVDEKVRYTLALHEDRCMGWGGDAGNLSVAIPCQS